MIKCNYEGCSEEAVVFDLPSKGFKGVPSYACHCKEHYAHYKIYWDNDIKLGRSTKSEAEYIEDRLKEAL